MRNANRIYHAKQGRKEKGAYLRYLQEVTGYKSLKTIIRKLSPKRKRAKRKRSGRRKILTTQEVDWLRELWFIMDQPCGKRMRSMLPDWLSSWEKRQTKPIPPEFTERVLSLSASTLDRVLSPFRVKSRKPAPESSVAALKAAIPYVEPILLAPEPGYLFVDTVAHCGGDMSGDFVWTLMVTDGATQYTLTEAIWNKGRYNTCKALNKLLRNLPMRKRQINTDNGSEFINYHLQAYLKSHYKTCKITRSRPGMKNDNARAEEKNLHVVRDLVGEERFEDESLVRKLNVVYRINNILFNHFHACSKLISRKRCGRELRKEYEEPKTPYQRLMESLPEGRRKETLRREHESLDPIELRERLEEALRRFYQSLNACSHV